MGQIIAVAGKGGTGKTTLAALVIRALKEEKAGSILAIDADPNSNLGETLGLKSATTVVGIVDDISKNPSSIPQGMTKDRFIDLKVQESLDEEDGFDLLSMGRPEGPGCYCFINNLLRGLIEKLMKNYDYIVVDNEAGMEHLSRRLVRRIDTLFVVSDSSVVGVRSASRIFKLLEELDIRVKEGFLALNKSRGNIDALKKEVDKAGLDLKMVLPLSEEIEDMAIENRPVFDLSAGNPVLNEIKSLFVKCQKE